MIKTSVNAAKLLCRAVQYTSTYIIIIIIIIITIFTQEAYVTQGWFSVGSCKGPTLGS